MNFISFHCMFLQYVPGLFLIAFLSEPRSCNSQAVKRRHMGKYVGVSLGNRVHRHSCGDENAGLWIQGVYIQPSSPSHTKYGRRTECDYYISIDRSSLAVQQRWFDGGC